MKLAMAYEWQRVRSLRSTWVLLALSAILTFASGLYWGAKTDIGDLDRFSSSLAVTVKLGVLLIASVGVCAFSLDYQHGTITTTRLVVRFPARIVAAKAAVVGALSAAAGVAMVVSTWGGILAGGARLPDDVGHVVGSALALVLLATLSGLVGVGLGGLVRNTGVAVGVFAVWVLLAETLLASLANVPPGRLPFNGTQALLHSGPPGWPGAVGFVVLAVVVLGGVQVALARRDS
ncbi:hypothetical protein LWC34_46285 [Kibdelosporangium philippinense]|uniref:ABC transporter permease n=1 Tax=Kibdelosporangium philippinense TaxID=211113 RepID=A0ABS8ZRF9_9PSEU|nr:hypothetical protein [Kibdelosporangium philippinense]MCE7010164.1 hypothetical protein [Kibdelosporangium philippinense]